MWGELVYDSCWNVVSRNKIFSSSSSNLLCSCDISMDV